MKMAHRSNLLRMVHKAAASYLRHEVLDTKDVVGEEAMVIKVAHITKLDAENQLTVADIKEIKQLKWLVAPGAVDNVGKIITKTEGGCSCCERKGQDFSHHTLRCCEGGVQDFGQSCSSSIGHAQVRTMSDYWLVARVLVACSY